MFRKKGQPRAETSDSTSPSASPENPSNSERLARIEEYIAILAQTARMNQLADMQRAEAVDRQIREQQARDDTEQARLNAESPAKKALREMLKAEKTKDARQRIALEAVRQYGKDIAQDLHQKGITPLSTTQTQYSRRYIVQDPRLVPAKSTPSVKELGWRDTGMPDEYQEPGRFRKWRNSRKGIMEPTPLAETIWVAEKKGEYGANSTDPIAKKYEMVAGWGIDSAGTIYLIDYDHIHELTDSVTISDNAGNSARTPNPYDYLCAHAAGSGTGKSGNDIEGSGYLAFYDHCVGKLSSMYQDLAGAPFIQQGQVSNNSIAPPSASI